MTPAFTIYLFILKTMKYYSVFQSFIILIFDEGEYYSYDLKDWKLFVNLIIYLFLIFLILVFNENLELNCFGLQKYTKRNIIKRANKDYLKNSENNKNKEKIVINKDDNENEEHSFDRLDNGDIMEIERFKFVMENKE